MSLDRSLKGKGGLVRHRNVLKRSERLVILKDEERWDDSKSVFGLPKVVVRKAIKRKAEKKEVVAEPGAEGAVAPAEGAAPAAKGAAPAAKGAAAPAAKGAAPAAKPGKGK